MPPSATAIGATEEEEEPDPLSVPPKPPPSARSARPPGRSKESESDPSAGLGSPFDAVPDPVPVPVPPALFDALGSTPNLGAGRFFAGEPAAALALAPPGPQRYPPVLPGAVTPAWVSVAGT